jgi:hypothetical protein
MNSPMLRRKQTRLISLTLTSLFLMNSSTFSKTSYPANTLQAAPTIEEVTKAANKAIVEGNWVTAESYFREAVRLAPTQGLWRIQLVLALGQQKKWKAALKEMAPLVRNRAVDWLLSLNEELSDGKVAFVNTAVFANEQRGISRYVSAVKEKKPVDLISRDIAGKLETFAKQHKLALVYDISKFKTLPFESGKTLDVTTDFIAYYNSSDFSPPQFGTVYLYRGRDTQDTPNYYVMMAPAVVYLDGKEFLSMPERSFIGFKLPPGRYLLQMRWRNISRSFEVYPGWTYYFRIETGVLPNYWESISDVEEKTALETIRKTYTLKDKEIKLKKFEVIKTNPGSH